MQANSKVLSKSNSKFTKSLKFNYKSFFVLDKKLLILLPYFVVAAMFIVFPMIMLFVKAAVPAEGHTQAETTSILEGAVGENFWKVMGRSVYLGLIAALISLVLAFPFAYSVSRFKSKAFKLIAITLLVSPLLIFTISKVFSLKIIILSMFDSPEAIKSQGTMLAGMVYLYMPFMIIPLYSVLNQMPKSLLEASKDLGYSSFISLFKVVIPYALKAIFSGLAIVFMMSSTSLVISNSLVGSPKALLIGNLMDDKAVHMRQNALAASQGSLIAIITIAVMMGVYGAIYIMPIIWRKMTGGTNA